jgi:hypothetical protein
MSASDPKRTLFTHHLAVDQFKSWGDTPTHFTTKWIIEHDNEANHAAGENPLLEQSGRSRSCSVSAAYWLNSPVVFYEALKYRRAA